MPSPGDPTHVGDQLDPASRASCRPGRSAAGFSRHRRVHRRHPRPHQRLHAAPDARPRRLERMGRPGRAASFPAEGGTAAGTFLAAGSSADSDAQFTYDVPVTDNDGESGTWSFSTVAAAASGRAALAMDRPSRLVQGHRPPRRRRHPRRRARVDRRTSSTPARRSAARRHRMASTTPGTANFTVQTGDVYGFVLRGSNGDSNDLLRGELTVGTVSRVLRRCPDPLRPVRPGRRPLCHPPRGRTALQRPLRRHGRSRQRQGLSRGPERTRAELWAVRGGRRGRRARRSRPRSRRSGSTRRA